jgi:clan AA aspartic protease (TIGR02281 family)
VREKNQIASTMNELADRITLLSQQGGQTQVLEGARAAAGQAREQYAEHVLQLRGLYDQLAERYQQLASDSEVQAAMETLNQSQGRQRRLGPTVTFRRHGATLDRLEETVFSQSVDLRKGPGGLFYVVAYLNGRHAQEIAVDTGASIVTLPEKIARQAGVDIAEDAPSITLRVADGNSFEAKQATIDTLRVGQFQVEDVTCTIIPEQFSEAPPLLGQSFLRHFVYKIDPQSGSLMMTKVSGPPAAGVRPR